MSRYKKYIGIKNQNVINILIHGGESSKDDWFIKDDYTKGGNFTAELEKNGLSYIACDMYGHGDWEAEEADFDSDDITDDIWPKVVSESVDYIVEMLVEMSEETEGKGEESDSVIYNIITYSVGSVIGLKLLEALEAFKDFNNCNIGEIIFCSLCPEKEYDDEYSLHNNLELLKDKSVTVFYGSQDDEQNPEEINEAFNLIDSNNKEIVAFDSGHSLPVEWVKSAIDKIVKTESGQKRDRK